MPGASDRECYPRHVVYVHRSSSSSLMRSLWTVPWFAFRSLLRQPRRSAMAVAAVTFGIVALMLASGFIEWIYFDLRESTIHAQLGHLQITRPGYQQGGRADPF